MKISHGKWCWWSRHIGGTSALDYLIKVRDMNLPEAVLEILREPPELPPTAFSKKARPRASPPSNRKLALPPQNENNDRLVDYLMGRGLHLELIDYCLKTGRLYESQEPRQSNGREVIIHNIVLVGKDKAGVYQPPEKIEDSTLPIAVEQYLKDHPEIQEIHLHFDRDATGRQATKIIQYHFAGRYEIIDAPPRRGKDVNEMLCL